MNKTRKTQGPSWQKPDEEKPGPALTMRDMQSIPFTPASEQVEDRIRNVAARFPALTGLEITHTRDDHHGNNHHYVISSPGMTGQLFIQTLFDALHDAVVVIHDAARKAGFEEHPQFHFADEQIPEEKIYEPDAQGSPVEIKRKPYQFLPSQGEVKEIIQRRIKASIAKDGGAEFIQDISDNSGNDFRIFTDSEGKPSFQSAPLQLQLTEDEVEYLRHNRLAEIRSARRWTNAVMPNEVSPTKVRHDKLDKDHSIHLTSDIYSLGTIANFLAELDAKLGRRPENVMDYVPPPREAPTPHENHVQVVAEPLETVRPEVKAR